MKEMYKTLFFSIIMIYSSITYSQDIGDLFSKVNSQMDSLDNYGINISTSAFRGEKNIEQDKMNIYVSKNTYRLTTGKINTYYSKEYQLVEDKENKVYYIGLNDQTLFKRGLTGRMTDSFMNKVIWSDVQDFDSIYKVTLVLGREGTKDSTIYFIDKIKNVITKTITWIPDEEKNYVGEEEKVQNELIRMEVIYKYIPYKKGKIIDDIILVEKDNIKLKEKFSHWEVINMIPIQRKILKQKGIKKAIKQNKKDQKSKK